MRSRYVAALACLLVVSCGQRTSVAPIAEQLTAVGASGVAPIQQAATASQPAMRHVGPHGPQSPIDPSRLPAPATGSGEFRITTNNTPLSFAHDSVGAFRTFCVQSHMAGDDPILRPQKPGAAHLHTFFGNTGTNAFSTAESIRNSGNSTCDGGTANRSSYWVPSIIDMSTGYPLSSNGLLVYYKSGYSGVAPSQINVLPPGLRMIAGSMYATSSAEQVQLPGHLTPVAYWTCNGSGRSLGIPSDCSPGSDLTMEVRFPQCCDGVNVDSPDHMSHMAYGTWGPIAGANGAGCPTSHPVGIPEITYHVSFTVPQGGPDVLQLASDHYTGGAGGYSLHADWWNGWDQGVVFTWTNNCARSLDCQVDFLGNGTRLN